MDFVVKMERNNLSISILIALFYSFWNILNYLETFSQNILALTMMNTSLIFFTVYILISISKYSKVPAILGTFLAILLGDIIVSLSIRGYVEFVLEGIILVTLFSILIPTFTIDILKPKNKTEETQNDEKQIQSNI